MKTSRYSVWHDIQEHRASKDGVGCIEIAKVAAR
jgi:hypothetical protein